MFYVVPLSKRDPACWRPAWGGVRLCGNGWWVRLIFGEWCRFAQDDTVGEADVVRNLLGWKNSSVKLTDTAFCFSGRYGILFSLTVTTFYFSN